jgi:hypothetical protein
VQFGAKHFNAVVQTNKVGEDIALDTLTAFVVSESIFHGVLR